MTMTMIGD